MIASERRTTPCTYPEALQLAAELGVHVHRIPMSGDCTAGVANVLGEHHVFLAESSPPQLAAASLLHELGHVIGGHFGAGYVDSTEGERTCLAEYDPWEREADLYMVSMLLTTAERALTRQELHALLLERVPLPGREWSEVRAPWLAESIAACAAAPLTH
jgi:hypothetical protein